MIIQIRGKRWKFVREYIKGALGTCDSRETKGKKIRVRPSLRGQTELDTIIHELLHASAWDVLDESFVDQTATDIARALYKIGYRKSGK
jgi:hypothetical protein